MQDLHPGDAPPALPWLEAGALRMALPAGPVTLAGREVALTEMERGVLRLLLLHQGRPLGRGLILERLYPAMAPGARVASGARMASAARVAPDARVVDVFVCRLRAKLAQAGLPGVIGTIWRQGYVLQPPRRLPGRPASPVPAERRVA